MRSSSVVVILGLIILAPQARAAKFTVQSEQGKTQFVAIGRPAMLKIRGEGQGPKGEVIVDEQKVNATLTFALEQLSTGISMRDEHMKKKYLEVEKFPKAELKLTQIDLPKGSAKDVPFKGELNLHGVTKSIEGKVDIEPTAVGYKVQSRFSLTLSDYKIDIPTYAGIKVADNVEIEIGFEVKK